MMAFFKEGWRVLAKHNPSLSEYHSESDAMFFYVFNGNPGYSVPLESYEVGGFRKDEKLAFARFLKGTRKIVFATNHGRILMMDRAEGSTYPDDVRKNVKRL